MQRRQPQPSGQRQAQQATGPAQLCSAQQGGHNELWDGASYRPNLSVCTCVCMHMCLQRLVPAVQVKLNPTSFELWPPGQLEKLGSLPKLEKQSMDQDDLRGH